MQRRIQIIIGTVLTVAVAAVFYFSFTHSHATRSADATAAHANAGPVKFRNPLTGQPQAEQKPFFAASVMLDNFFDVKTHPGMDQAAIVYEALAEGDITRWMAVFDSTQTVTQFGPIRSLRPYFLEWAQEYGGVLMHVGGSFDALNRIKKASDIINIDQIGANERYFKRDETIAAPHNVFSSYSSWLEIGERFTVEPAQFSPWQFIEPDKNDLPGHQIDIAFAPDNHVSWVYNIDSHSYLRFFNDERQFFDSGKQLTGSNIILIEVPSKVIDDAGRRTMQTIGSGSAIVYTNARRHEGTWSKKSPQDRIRFYDSNQKEIVLTPGATWIEAVPDMSMVSYKLLD